MKKAIFEFLLNTPSSGERILYRLKMWAIIDTSLVQNSDNGSRVHIRINALRKANNSFPTQLWIS